MPHAKTIAITAACALALLTSGCATNPADSHASSAPYADVLKSPDRLEPAASGTGALVWIDPNVDFATYNKFLVDPIQIRLADDAAYKTLDPASLNAMAEYLRSAIVKALQPTYKVVSEPGTGVLRVRITITDLVPTKPEFSVVALVVPYATVADVASGPVDGGPAGSTAYLGRTGIAGSLVDAESNQVLAEYADTTVGRKYVVDVNHGVQTAVTTGVEDYLDAYTPWAYAKQAFDGWARDLRRWVDKVHRVRSRPAKPSA